MQDPLQLAVYLRYIRFAYVIPHPCEQGDAILSIISESLLESRKVQKLWDAGSLETVKYNPLFDIIKFVDLLTLP